VSAWVRLSQLSELFAPDTPTRKRPPRREDACKDNPDAASTDAAAPVVNNRLRLMHGALVMTSTWGHTGRLAT